MTDTAPWPVELRVSADRRTLSVTWDDGRSDALAAELLRVESPSAEVRGHGGAGEKQLVPGKRLVEIRGVEAVGSYAVRIVFSDGHATGIYTWPQLRRFGAEGAALLAAYEAALAQRGWSRDG